MSREPALRAMRQRKGDEPETEQGQITTYLHRQGKTRVRKRQIRSASGMLGRWVWDGALSTASSNLDPSLLAARELCPFIDSTIVIPGLLPSKTYLHALAPSGPPLWLLSFFLSLPTLLCLALFCLLFLSPICLLGLAGGELGSCAVSFQKNHHPLRSWS